LLQNNEVQNDAFYFNYAVVLWRRLRQFRPWQPSPSKKLAVRCQTSYNGKDQYRHVFAFDRYVSTGAAVPGSATCGMLRKLSKAFGRYCYLIDMEICSNCFHVEKYSCFPNEKEVLLLPNATFVVQQQATYVAKLGIYVAYIEMLNDDLCEDGYEHGIPPPKSACEWRTNKRVVDNDDGPANCTLISRALNETTSILS